MTSQLDFQIEGQWHPATDPSALSASTTVTEVSPENPPPPSEFEYITKLLPSCQRCKRLRRKCDTFIPSCRPCAKAKVPCTFQDNILQQVLPRSYVQGLLTRLEQLKSAQAAAQGLVDIFQSDIIRPSNDLTPSPTLIAPSQPAKQSYDIHCLLDTNGAPTLRFFGCSSAMALTVELLSQVYTDGIVVPSSNLSLFLPPPNDIAAAYNQPNYNSLLSRDALLPLIQIYLQSLNLIYPFIDETIVDGDLESVLVGQQPETPGSSILTGHSAYQYFRICMLCANACAIKSRHEPHFTSIGNAYYNEALRHVEEVTSEVSAESLQSLLLLIVYCLFYPQKGDIWKLLDFACRLSVELGYHREEVPSLQDNIDDERRRGLRRSCFWSLYTIERIVGQLFGRTSDLPEPIITTDYPIYSDRQVEDRVMLQLMSATHHHRLVYLRSELYRHMYLPTNPPLDNIKWFEDQFCTLLQWHRDLEFEKYTPGVSTITCTVAFCATIIFLFQPLMLRALSTREANSNLPDAVTKVPSDNYYSACKLITTYEEVLHAPESSSHGVYPMTFMSAHYIYLAGLTLMAHCLLSINGCVEVLPPWGSPHAPPGATGVDFSDIFEISSSCMVLLTWCAGQWRGMSGMLDTYKRLSESLLPQLMQKVMATRTPT